jgi:hypothetical protein
MRSEFAAFRGEMREFKGEIRPEIASLKVWAIGMYHALAGSLSFVMAKGFKWL